MQGPIRPGKLGSLAGYAFVAPALAVYGAFVLWPLGRAVWLSFYSWDGAGQAQWVGLANFSTLIHDPSLRSTYVHAAVLIPFYCVLPVVAALALAGIAARTRIRGLGTFRAVLFLPQILPLVVVGTIWREIYAPSGMLNGSLKSIGAGSFGRAWLGNFNWALPAIGGMGTWVQFGLALVLFLAGVQKIPTSLYEAARVDGSGRVREFFAVTLPGLRYELIVVFIVTLIGALRTFDLIFVTTNGGPGTATVVPSLQVYREAFQYGQVGLAAALGLGLTIVISVVTITSLRIAGRRRA